MMRLFAACAILLPAPSAGFPPITGYVPASDVSQHLSLDLDQKEMEEHLNVKDGEGNRIPDYTKAAAIYNSGAHSGAFAILTVSALSAGHAKQKVTQGSAQGVLTTAVVEGVSSVTVTYTSTCREGGTASPDTSGCFKDSNAGGGNLVFENGGDVGPALGVENKYQTLAGFSVDAQSKMQGQEYYAAFRAYYNNGDYGHRLVEAGLQGSGECATCDAVGRVEFTKKSTAYLSVWMYVIRQMEDAIVGCSVGCTGCNDDQVHAWDQAVAFYSGSLEGISGNSQGKLLYRFAIKRCGNFGTCGSSGTGVNAEIIEQFTLGKAKLLEGKCAEVIPIKRRIVQLMSVPMVQGSLRYAWKVGVDSKGSKEKAEGFIFSAGILPLVAVCDATAAATIAQNMNYAATSTSWPDVKAAYERNYACLGMTCAQVNGLVQGGDCADEGGTYCEAAEPCSDAPAPVPTPAPAPRDETLDWVMMGVTFVVTAVVTSLVFIFLKPFGLGQQTNQQELVSA